MFPHAFHISAFGVYTLHPQHLLNECEKTASKQFNCSDI